MIADKNIILRRKTNKSSNDLCICIKKSKMFKNQLINWALPIFSSFRSSMFLWWKSYHSIKTLNSFLFIYDHSFFNSWVFFTYLYRRQQSFRNNPLLYTFSKFAVRGPSIFFFISFHLPLNFIQHIHLSFDLYHRTQVNLWFVLSGDKLIDNLKSTIILTQQKLVIF